jgi:hypothetical protein
MEFASITLELSTPLHIGKGRCGMLAKSFGFVPGHIISYALANVLAKQQYSGKESDFQRALKTIRSQLRCGPFFIQEGDEVLLPLQDETLIESHYLIGSNHVTLYPDTRTSVETALFEIEAIAPYVLRGDERGEPTRLVGGIWYESQQLGNSSISDCLNQCWLGGEIKTGFGRVKCIIKPKKSETYPGIKGKCDDKGVHLEKGAYLPGPALAGVINSPIRPWVGRLYDEKQGFGRRLGSPALVRMDGKVEQDACFLPVAEEKGFGCWSPKL